MVDAECSICTEPYDTNTHEPMFLLCCCQTICSSCVAYIELRRNERPYKIACPLCNVPAEAGWSKRNRAFTDLVCKTDKEASSTKLACDVCLSHDELLTVPDYHCFECQHWLCDHHKRSHQRRAHDNVSTINVVMSDPLLKSKLIRQFPVRKCSIHDSDNLLLNWCFQCNTAVCRKCQHENHVRHQIQWLPDAWTDHCSATASLMQAAESRRQERSDRLDGIKKSSKLLTEDIDCLGITLKYVENGFAKQVHEHVTQLLTECRALVAGTQVPMNQEAIQEESRCTQYRQSIDALQATLKDCNLSVSLSAFHSCQKLLDGDTEPLLLPSSERLPRVTLNEVSAFQSELTRVLAAMFQHLHTKTVDSFKAEG